MVGEPRILASALSSYADFQRALGPFQPCFALKRRVAL